MVKFCPSLWYHISYRDGFLLFLPEQISVKGTSEIMNKKRSRKAVIFLLLTMLLVVAVSVCYGTYIHRIVEAETSDYMEELSKQSIKIINERISNDYLYLEGIAKSIGSQKKEIYADTIMDILERRTKTTRFTGLFVADINGDVYYKNQQKNINVSERTYFQKAMEGQVSVECVHDENGVHEIVTAVPISRQGEIIGAVLGQYRMEELQELIDVNYFGGAGYVMIARPDGDILVRDKRDKSDGSDNFNDAVDDGSNDITEEEMAQLSKAMSVGGNGTFSFTNNEETYFMSYASLGINDWYLLSVIPKDVINARTLNIIYATVFYGASVLLILGIIAGWAFYGWKRNRRHVERADKKIQSIYRTVPGAIVSFVVDDECRILNANAAFYHLVGCTEEEFERRYGGKLLRVLAEEERDKFSQSKVGMNSQEFLLLDANGKEKWIFANFDIQEIEGKRIAQAALIDTSLQRERLTQAELSARIDSLTGLKNKRGTEAEIDALMEACGRKGTFFMMDLDNFKQVNDTFGHLEGDRMLQLLAESIREVFRSDDFAGRIGGDEFLVYMQKVSRKDLAAKKAEQLITEFDSRLPAEVRELGLSVSIGIALGPRDGTGYLELYDKADRALYAAKSSGRKYWKFWDEVEGKLE